ncbi:MAG: ATP-binding protein [Actinomycetota bacterium]|nr:CHASE3 domain-containing protein [Actinomycetota bacterium]
MKRNKPRRGVRLWSNLPLRAKGIIVILIPLVPVAFAGASSMVVSHQEQKAQALVEHTMEVKSSVQGVLHLAVDAETGVRGYLLTGQHQFLQPFSAAQQQLPRAIVKLRSEVRGNASETARATKIGKLALGRLDAMDSIQQNFANGVRPTTEQLLAGKKTMDKLRAQLDVMNSEESNVLDMRVAAVNKERQRQIIASIGTLALGLVGGLLAMFLFTAGIVRRTHLLERNARWLAEGRPMETQWHGSDEIGELGAELNRAAALLANREGDLAEAQTFLENLVATSPGGISKLRLVDMSFTYVSPRFEQMLGYEPGEIKGLDFWGKNVHPDDRGAVTRKLDWAIAERVPEVEIEYRFRHQSGEFRWYATLLRFEDNRSATPTSAVGFTLDVAERKQAETQVRIAKEEAERANQAKSEFLSRMSHELRTPLNAILGFAQLLELDDLSGSQKESIDHIADGGRHLLELINEVLDIARIESGRIALSLEPVSLTEVIQESFDLIRPLAVENSIELMPWTTDDYEVHVYADRQRAKQVLLNLLSNAVKYNRAAGSVEVRVEHMFGRMRVTVSDTGLGIPPDKVGDIFTPFHRLGAEQTDVEGTGLGLALSKRLVEAMGGTLSVQSTVGEGTSFYFDLAIVDAPLSALEQDAQDASHHTAGTPPPSPILPGEHKTLLYIEDNLSNLRLVERILADRPDIKVMAAMHGGLGLDLAREHVPDMILLDLNLPDMHGDELIQILHAHPRTNGIPVVILSADATESQVERLMNRGALAYLTKPLDVKRFLKLVNETLGAPVVS